MCTLIANLTPQLQKPLYDYISGKLNWSFCVSICMDGTAAMTGRLSDFSTQVKEVASQCESTHCVLHREMLASQKMSLELNNILQDVIKITTTLKYMPLNDICSHSSVRRWMQSTCTFSFTQK